MNIQKIEFASKPKEGQPWDVAIIGSGPAGLTAAIYTTRGAASTIILGGENWGGQLMLTTTVDNFPGFPDGIQGPELMALMRKQAERFGAEFIQESVRGVDFSKEPKELIASDDKKYLAKTVIITTGADTKWLGVPGEEKLRGRGVSSCAPCDAPFFKGKSVIVIGGGDAAMEEALVLTKYANEVTIVHRKDVFRASAVMQQKVFELEKQGKIKIMWNSEVEEFVGRRPEGASGPEGDVLGRVKIKNSKTGRSSEFPMDGAFVAIGHIPATAFYKGIELDEKGYIRLKAEIPNLPAQTGSKLPITNEYKTKTSVEGVFTAGDVHDIHYRQAITAAGLGCMAGMDALKYLDKNGPSW